jgi:crossover junction endodeoxyribonuclease RuvC
MAISAASVSAARDPQGWGEYMASNEYIQLFACDLSMNRPGFAVLECDIATRKVRVLYKSNVNNKIAKPKTHARKLVDIANEIKKILIQYPCAYPVQEDALGMMTLIGGKNMYSAKTIQVLARVVGLSEYLAMDLLHTEFDRIHPKNVKKLVTGNSSAEKEDVAKALTQFVGDLDYECDDESDAVAVGIAWLIENNFIDDPYAEKPL